jgi:prepilin-type N-terminal cleavage/methylation domain-containing protein
MRHMTRLRNSRMTEERGFSLVEMLVVLMIIAVLLVIAVPSYLGFKERADARAAAANVRAAVPSAVMYHATHANYDGMDLAALRAIDGGIHSGLVVAETDVAFTLSFTSGTCTATFAGPGGSAPTVTCT